MSEPKDQTEKSGELRCSTFRVTGHAMIPVEVQIEIEAIDEAMAMRVADKVLSTGRLIYRHIVNGSEDESAAHSFKACAAEKLNT